MSTTLENLISATGGMTRRDWLWLSAAGLGLSGLPVTPAYASPARSTFPGFGKAKSVLLVYASGGQSQLDLWDPKPEAPDVVRGAFRPIATQVAGLNFCEHLPRLAQVADLFTVVRSVSHEDTDHGSASYLALTGQYHSQRSANPTPRPEDLPNCGAVVKRLRPSERMPYSAIQVNGPALVPTNPAPGQNAGFLGPACDPLTIGNVTTGALPIEGLEPLLDVNASRSSARRSLLRAIDAAADRAAGNAALFEMNTWYNQAYELLATPRIREAFDLSREPDSLRERYGRNRSGQACLLARRLVEAEVPWITVVWSHTNRGQDKDPNDTDRYGWDTHNDIFEALEHRLLPRFDLGFSALLQDLNDRNLLDQTLVVCMGEFGRAPLVALEPKFAGSSPGRKHWAAVYSIVMAGARVSRGAIYGASDRHGAYPKSNVVAPWDIAATMFAALGIDPATHYRDLANRPWPVATGMPIEGLYT